ncbi:MAG: efflux transporter outer membrane subunit [Methylophilaceae bacterium]|nr:efflux transporter outer membrane subunit [Methylophilaceae bacterium]
MRDFKKKTLFGMLMLGLISLPGCSNLRTPIHAPDVVIPAQWNTTTAAANPEQELWWKNFNDPELDALIDKALNSNNDFSAAIVRVHRAQLQAGLVDTNRTPFVSAGINSRITHAFDPAATYRSSGMGSSLSYELDLWGKLASQRDAAHWEVQATAADCRSFAISLLATTARLYWQTAYLNQLLSLNTADIEYAEKTLSLANVRKKSGATSALYTAEAERNLALQRAYRTQLQQQRMETRHALAILFNQPPQSEVVDPVRLASAPLPEVAAGIPAEILANRPDMQAAELRLRETIANVDYTRTSFYPTLSLTGSLGTSSTSLLSLLQNPLGSLGAGIILPFIQWNTMQLAVRVSKTQNEEAILNYRQRLYTAFAEVEDSLSARTQFGAEEKHLQNAIAQSRRAETIARTRYQNGYTDIQLWLDAQAALRGAERSLALNKLNQLNNQVNLYKALGLSAGSNQIRCN